MAVDCFGECGLAGGKTHSTFAGHYFAQLSAGALGLAEGKLARI